MLSTRVHRIRICSALPSMRLVNSSATKCPPDRVTKARGRKTTPTM